MRLYSHTGNGHYLGSAVIVWADSRATAEGCIRAYLDSSGLKNEPLNVTEQELAPSPVPTIVYSVGGDY